MGAVPIVLPTPLSEHIRLFGFKATIQSSYTTFPCQANVPLQWCTLNLLFYIMTSFSLEATLPQAGLAGCAPLHPRHLNTIQKSPPANLHMRCLSTPPMIGLEGGSCAQNFISPPLLVSLRGMPSNSANPSARFMFYRIHQCQVL